MKKLIFALAGASVALSATPAAAAQGFGHNDRGRYEQVQKRKVVKRNGVRIVKKQTVRYDQARKWRKGQRFDSRYAYNYRVIHNPRAYHLYDAPRGYRWVQSGNDAVLVAITSGIIGAIIGSAL